jgi:hypothetical protein
MSAVRFWQSKIDSGKLKETAQGGLHMPAALTSVGVFEYEQDDGSIVKEYRPPDEVFADASIASMHDVPVTIGHPDTGSVTTQNYKDESVGHVSSTGIETEDNQYLTGFVLVNAGDAVSAIMNGELSELSVGYTVKEDHTPGKTPGGESYDVVQRNIRYNHIALLQSGTGREGGAVKLRLDSQGNQVQNMSSHKTGVAKVNAENEEEKDKMDEGLSPEDVAALKTLVSAVPKLLALLESGDGKENAEDDPETDDKGSSINEEKENEEEDKDEDGKRINAADISAMIAEGVDIRHNASLILGEDFCFTGLTNEDIMSHACKRVNDKFTRKGKSPAFLRGEFLGALQVQSLLVKQKSEAESAASSGNVMRSNVATPTNQMAELMASAWKAGK